MKSVFGKLAAAALAAGALTTAVPAAAATFAQVGISSGTPTFTLTNTGGGAASIAGSGVLNFNALDGLGNLGPNVAVNYSLTGASTGQAATMTMGSNTYISQLFNGAFNFTFANATMLNGQTYAAGSTLFGGAFTEALFNGRIGSTTGSILSGGVTSFTNGALTFQPGALSNFEFGLASISNGGLSGTAAGGINGFSSVLNGKFDNEGQVGLPGVPEPATWAMMTLGFGMLGGALRRRARLGVVTTA